MAGRGKCLLLLQALLAFQKYAQGIHTTNTLYAKSTSNSEGILFYANDERRTYTIVPAAGYSASSYYLEISWSSTFDVKGNMPYCSGDYVQVYLTSSFKDIGKFCSLNAGRPFPMYSNDCYAKIVFYSDGVTKGNGFRFHYRLRSKSTQYINNYLPSSSYCYNTYNYASSGLIYSAGWPAGYQSSHSDCEYLMIRISSNYATKIVFMDINLSTGSYNDHVQLYGSNDASDYQYYSISSPIYSTTSIKTYRRTYKYLQIRFDRTQGSNIHRGFVAGYIQYSEMVSIKRTHSSISSPLYVIPITMIAFIFVALAVYRKVKRQRATRRNRAAVFVQDSTPRTVTSQQTTHTFSDEPYPTGATVAPKEPQYPFSYPTSVLSAAPPPHYASTFASNENASPVGEVPPPYTSLDTQAAAEPQRQDETGLPCPPVVSTQHGYQPPSSNWPPPNVPPPSYDAAVSH